MQIFRTFLNAISLVCTITFNSYETKAFLDAPRATTLDQENTSNRVVSEIKIYLLLMNAQLQRAPIKVTLTDEWSIDVKYLRKSCWSARFLCAHQPRKWTTINSLKVISFSRCRIANPNKHDYLKCSGCLGVNHLRSVRERKLLNLIYKRKSFLYLNSNYLSYASAKV